MSRIEHILIVAGPTACGKSAFIRDIVASGLPELQRQIGIERLHEWPRKRTATVIRQPDPELKHLILHYDFLWSYPGPNLEMMDGQRALSSILEGAREISFVTLWTPPARLERQVIEGKLRIPLQPNRVQLLKAGIFRRLPRSVIRGLSRFPLLKQISRRLPGHAFLHYLLVLKVCSRPDRVVALYRRWFQFCDRQFPNTRAHVIVEYDGELKFYSRDEWENRVRIYERGECT